MGKLEWSRSVPSPALLRSVCIMQLLSPSGDLWPLCPFSLLTLLTHMSRSSRAQRFCPWPWGRCLLWTPAHCSACCRKDSSRVVFLRFCRSCCAFWGEMGQLGRKKTTFGSNTVTAEEEPCLGLCWALMTRTRGGTLGKPTFWKRSWV